MAATTAVPSLRGALRAELAAAQSDVHHLLDSVSDADWGRRSANRAWTVGELLAHLTWSLEQLPREVERARQGRGMYNLPPALLGPLNVLVTRLYARRHTARTIARRYDDAAAAALRVLEGVRDDEWALGGDFWGEGFHDVEALCRAQARHVAEHARDILAVLPRASEGKTAPGSSR